MEEERVYTIPLKEAKKTKRKKRAGRAAKIIKQFVSKHLDVSEVKLDSDLNEKIWSHGAEDPPSQIRVRVTKRTDEVAEASPLE
ncbi:50S ribosomal protein L31 [candidate division MSBL1 archaeon SCGC-AAA259E19]|uniref:Large ribosomal subunit protein eL31 n=1 Tax=candidate division MSBL1 archaeon SCGC-AAA259E19 TaxID=1698264 RepID=A0A133UNF6_9EURY|nr:50S ribosomal protein L31 [candidate division MSBL1 archaeon SCGC-AAA259E19]